jgi:hypothetical protein
VTRRYSVLRALGAAVYDRGVYRDAAFAWRGVGLLYLLLLAGIVTAFVVIRIAIGLSGMAAQAPAFLAQLPTITVDHGRVSIDRPSPVTLRDPKTGKAVAIIDTSGGITSLDQSDATILVTADRLIYRKSAAETRTFDLSRVEHFVLDRALATRWTRLFATWTPALVLPFVLVGLYAVRMIQQLLAALVVWLVGRGAVGDFAAAMRLGALVITPATLALDIAGFAGLHVPASGWLWCAISVGYVLFAVSSLRAAPAVPESGEAVAAPH